MKATEQYFSVVLTFPKVIVHTESFQVLLSNDAVYFSTFSKWKVVTNSLTHLTVFSKQHVIRKNTAEVEHVHIVFDCHLEVGQRIHSLNRSV